MARELVALGVVLVAAVCLVGGGGFAAASYAGVAGDAAALLELKARLIDGGALSHWRADNAAALCATWEGVTCSSSSSVTSLNFTNFNVNGTLTSALCGLRNLSALIVRFNNLNQTFPAWLLDPAACPLPRLAVLDLSENYFWGALPSAIANLSALAFLSLESNYFTGPVPAAFGALPALTLLRLRGNPLSGPVPAHLANLSALVTLDLSYSSFSPSPIPPHFSNLSSLQTLELEACSLTGSIPASLHLLRRLTLLDLAHNHLSGAIPPQLSLLSNLSSFYLYFNNLSGPLPASLSNLSHLVYLDFSNNALHDRLPDGLAQLQNLRQLHLFYNDLSGALPDGLADLPNLVSVALYNNRLSGNVSSRWGIASRQLVQLDLSYNFLSGSLPPHICDGGSLLYLALQSNQFSGGIPASYGSCDRIARFELHSNQLTGAVPANIWTLPNMTVLMLQNNSLSGSIVLPAGVSLPLQELDIDSNQFDGPLPSEIGRYWNLSKVSAGQNKFSGPLPSQIGELSELNSLNLSHNSLSGQIPDTIGNCSKLTALYLSSNYLTGQIPSQLSQVPVLTYLDVSRNRLSGSIPSSLGGTKFVVFDVSDNDLSGPIPESLAVDFPSTSFEGNSELCFPESCPMDTQTGKKNVKLVVLLVLGAFAVASCSLVSLFFLAKRKHSINGVADWKVISFQRINFNEDELLASLDEKNLIGCGGSGKVYKVELSPELTVAVKKMLCPRDSNGGLRQVEDLAWKAEIAILGKIKHHNVVKLMCSCVSDDAKLLVYEYMPNGSLGDLLHRSSGAQRLNWATRFRIALGAAEGLEYLHHDCVPLIVHRDVKANNILVDSKDEAKLADFGAAKTFEAKGGSMTGVVGSVGYIAPEYAYTLKVDEKSDVYSYGVVLLELVTGKNPTNEKEFEGVDVVRWVERQVHSKESIWRVFDSRLGEESDKESMLMVLKIALRCTSVLPQRRPSMREVVEFLRRAKPGGEDTFYYWQREKRINIIL